MLEHQKIIEIAQKVATANLTGSAVSKVLSRPATDSEGQEALRITIVIEPDVAAKLEGDAVLDTLVEIQDQLRKAGEDRFPIVEYATKEDLKDADDR